MEHRLFDSKLCTLFLGTYLNKFILLIFGNQVGKTFRMKDKNDNKIDYLSSSTMVITVRNQLTD
jgi:hypothetical protein